MKKIFFSLIMASSTMLLALPNGQTISQLDGTLGILQESNSSFDSLESRRHHDWRHRHRDCNNCNEDSPRGNDNARGNNNDNARGNNNGRHECDRHDNQCDKCNCHHEEKTCKNERCICLCFTEERSKDSDKCGCGEDRRVRRDGPQPEGNWGDGNGYDGNWCDGILNPRRLIGGLFQENYGHFFTSDTDVLVAPGLPVELDSFSFATDKVTLNNNAVRLTEPGQYLVKYGAAITKEAADPVAQIALALDLNPPLPGTNIALPVETLLTTGTAIIDVETTPAVLRIINAGPGSFRLNSINQSVSAYLIAEKLNELDLELPFAPQ